MEKYKIFVLQKEDKKSTKKINFFYNKQHTSILDTLEKKIQIDFQCRKGFCGICRIYLKKGKIKYHNQPLAFIHKNEILPCSCQPISDIFIVI
ncbi:MAG: class I ribonucleotide reductase maintenance protein YfaE [Arsenophonus sp.]|nr:MAG: class I ribonucleotide reductase maintenance protein YfaE [Arsenophonus sp.]